ncbi:hypothetical protein XAB3213_3720023 [Xanthomonas citri pv. bilvae]|nr:hypothetical protein XAB3213_3720023 [Xanthomonas citri pv. bilvae]
MAVRHAEYDRCQIARCYERLLTPTPGPRLRRGRSQARAPMARKLCLLASVGEGLSFR